jgi:hypothetical protein
MNTPLQIAVKRIHLTRLMAIWRSAGWPCSDAVELDLLAAGWVTLSTNDGGCQALRLTDAGIRLLAESRQHSRRALSAHDRLAHRVAAHLASTGRVVWRELSLRAKVGAIDVPATGPSPALVESLWPEDEGEPTSIPEPQLPGRASWRVARPDVFSVRNTSVEDYLQPMVHEVKVSRPDLLSDLRHAAKRESYQWLSCETYYVFPVGVAMPEEIPEPFGVWVLNGTIEDGAFELIRPARHVPCKLPFAVWMALAKAAPAQFDTEPAQGLLGGTVEPGADAALGA